MAVPWHARQVKPDTLRTALAGEGGRVEWKESARDGDEILRAVCALANDLGETGETGILIVGVDKHGRPVGADASDAALTKLSDRLRSTKILPHPSCDVEVVDHVGVKLVIVTVAPYAVPPVVKVDGVPWVRVGPSTHRASEADLARLGERRPEPRLPFDLRSLPGTQTEDLDLERLRMEYSANLGLVEAKDEFPQLEPWLRQREIVKYRDGAWRPTGAGILVYGTDPQGYIPGAVVEFTRYAGDTIDAPVVSRKTISGRLPDQLEGLWTQLQANLVSVSAPAQGVRTPYVAEYPLEALKELARNLVQHRMYDGTNAPSRVSWFEDRIEMTNPGGPFGQASEGEFGAHSDYRNPTVTRLLVDLGYVERLGRGVQRVRALLSSNGNAPLEVETDGYTTLVVRRRR
jgi:ATP-dependent DNA helicase RecG